MPGRSIDLRNALIVGVTLMVAAFLYTAGGSRDPAAEFGIREVAIPEARSMIEAGALVIDVRDAAVARASHVPGAILIPLEGLRSSLSQVGADQARPIVVYCGDGARRGPEATAILNQAGHANAVNLKGGIEGWRSQGLATASR